MNGEMETAAQDQGRVFFKKIYIYKYFFKNAFVDNWDFRY